MVSHEQKASACGDSPLMAVVPGVISAGTLLVAFTLLAAGFEHFWITFVLGFGVVLPVAMGVARHRQDSPRGRESTVSGSMNATPEEDAALARLRQRYARGEVSDTEFERRLERLIETESSLDRRDTTTERKN